MKRKPMITLLLIVLLSLGFLASCAHNAGNSYPLDGAYTSFDALESRLASFVAVGGELCELKLIGFSGTDQLPIHALRIGSKAASRKVLVIGQHHGDEVLGIEVVLGIAEQLKAPDKKFNAILEQFQIWIIPTLNPEGWREVSRGNYQWKRKNNRDTNNNKKFELREDGVDLNRNYPVFWAEDQLTASSNPYYKGSSAASESEIQALLKFVEKADFELAVFYHSSASGAYSEKLYLPWYDKKDKAMTRRYQKNEELAQSYAGSVKKDYGRGTYEVQTGISSKMGSARNYFFHALSTPAFLIEIGGINAEGISVIHPGSKMMQTIVKKHVAAFKTLLISLPDQGSGLQYTDEEKK